MIDLEQEEVRKGSTAVVIKVVGVGGAGGNTVNSIIESGYKGIECLAVNTDSQSLEISKADVKIQLGMKSTKGLGTGANPELGKRAAEEDLDKVMDVLEGADIVFLAAGMGGGTGSGALPVIARALKESGILSIAVVTKPFKFEGKKRARVAEEAIALIKKEVDTLLIIPNQKLLEVTDKDVSMIDGFALINNVLGQSVKGISEIITYPGHINVDFADVRAIMKDMGLAVMGSGTAIGQNRAKEAALQAISSPLLENMSIQGARGVLLNITGGRNLGLHEISDAASIIYEKADDDANIILGSVIDESMDEEVTVTVIATGFSGKRLEDTDIDMQVKGTVVDKSKTPSNIILPFAKVTEDRQEKEVVLVKKDVEENEITLQEQQEYNTGTTSNNSEQTIHQASAFAKARAILGTGQSLSKVEVKDRNAKGADRQDVPRQAQDEENALSKELINLNDLDVPTFLRKSVLKDVEKE